MEEPYEKIYIFQKIYKGGPYEKYQLFHIIGGWWYLWFPLQIGKELYFQTPKNKGGQAQGKWA